ncbi:MAG: hypothetical protein ABIJ09_15540 [Pseudomonadota bacterium]
MTRGLILSAVALLVPTTPVFAPRQLAVPAVGFNLVENEEGRGFGSQAVLARLDRLADTGASCVALVLAARLRGLDDDSPRAPALPDAAQLRRLTDHAHRRGLQVLVVPHLWIDGDLWRGDLRRSAARARAFFDGYGAFIDEVATRAEQAGVDGLSFGVELKGLTADPANDARFFALIGRLRSRFSGLLTYSANWDEVAQVRFWDQLDFISVNGFAPLTASLRPTPRELDLGAAAMVQELTGLATRFARPVLLIEAGYKATTDNAREPWVWPASGTMPVDADAQLRAYRALLQALRKAPRIVGVLFWQIDTGADGTPPRPLEPAWGFSPLDRSAEQEVRKHAAWAREQRAVGRVVSPPPATPTTRP